MIDSNDYVNRYMAKQQQMISDLLAAKVQLEIQTEMMAEMLTRFEAENTKLKEELASLKTDRSEKKSK